MNVGENACSDIFKIKGYKSVGSKILMWSQIKKIIFVSNFFEKTLSYFVHFCDKEKKLFINPIHVNNKNKWKAKKSILILQNFPKRKMSNNFVIVTRTGSCLETESKKEKKLGILYLDSKPGMRDLQNFCKLAYL